MSPSHRDFLERSALREAQRAMLQDPGTPITKDEFLATRIQVLEPLKRILLLLVGLALGGAAYWLHREVGNLTLTVFFAALATVVAWVALFGFLKTVENALGASADFVFRRFLDTL